jgi:HTH-type transcriptional regulator/antitoxin HigA
LTTANTFLSDWASPPGDTITELLEELNVGLDDFAEKMQLSKNAAVLLIRGQTELTQERASQLRSILGGSKQFWISREQQYRQAVRRIQDCQAAESGKSWLDEIPTKDLIKFGWINLSSNKSNNLTECLRFFEVADVQEWRAAYERAIGRTAFRTSASFDSNPGALAAWLRRSELEAEAIKCQPWNPETFREALDSIRKLTRKRNPKLFLPELISICAASGVAVVVVRTPSGCRASGSTRFMSDTKAILALSFRYLSDDHFWFTFFHEAAHLLLHQHNRLFLEGEPKQNGKEEEEANHFAANTLIPSSFQSQLLKLSLNAYAVIRFARELGISPGIVVGQLQHAGRFKHNQLNNLKTRFKWEE